METVHRNLRFRSKEDGLVFELFTKHKQYEEIKASEIQLTKIL